jgi:carbamoyltransferase
MLILGLNMFHADASAAIVEDGKILFAVAEERLNRHKHYGGFPALAVKACLDAAGAKITDVQHVAVGQDSDANLAKKVQYALANPGKILNFIKMRQRKESMRDVRSLLSQSLDVDASTLEISGASSGTPHRAHRQFVLLFAVGKGGRLQLRRFGRFRLHHDGALRRP